MDSVRVFILVLLAASLIGGCTSKVVNRQLIEVKTEPEKFRAETLELLSSDSRIDVRAFQHFINGVLYEQTGQVQAAVESYRRAWSYFPESREIGLSVAMGLYRMQQFDNALRAVDSIAVPDVDVYDLRASIHRAQGQDDLAKEDYLNLVLLDSANSRAFSFLAGVYRHRGDLDSTIWAYQHLAESRPGQYRLWTELGRLQAQQGDYEGAGRSFERSISYAPDATNIQSYLGLAHVLEMTGQIDSALAILNTAVEIDDHNVLIHRALRSLYVGQDSLQLALPHAREESELSPLDRAAARRLGLIYYWLDSLQQADSVFSYLVTSGDRHPTNHSILGRIALQQDDLERSRDEFIQVTRLADSLVDSWLDLGYVYRQLQQFEAEFETYQTGLNHMRSDNDRLRLLFALGAAYEQRDRIDEAVATFEEIIAHDPDYAQALNYLGYMLADRGEKLDYARDLLERAVQISPDNAAYLDSYGWVFYQLGKYDRALKHLRKAVQLDTDPVIFDHLGDVYQAIGEDGQARTWWQRALDLDPDNQQIRSKLGL